MYSLRTLLLPAIVVQVLTQGAVAQQLTTKQIDAFSNLQMEYTVCLAYFMATKSCAPKEMEAETSQLDPNIKRFQEMAVRIAQTIKMSNDAMSSRLQMAFDDQTRVINKSCVNFSSLYRLHGARCKRLGENADSIFDEYMKK
jgi:hypothetical protein